MGRSLVASAVTWMRRVGPKALGLSLLGLALAGGSGFLTSAAFGVGAEAAKTVTVSVATGPRGPQGEKGDRGPQGPQGERGPQGDRGPAGISCPDGYAPGKLVINAPGGQVVLWTCLA